MQQRPLRPDLQEIVDDLLALRAMTKHDILTHKSQRELVKDLNPRDMADVSRAVYLEEKRLKESV